MTQDSRRERILERATELFHREGFHAVGVDRLAAEAGVSKKTLYQLFQSKERLLLETLRAGREMAVADLPDEHDDRSERERLVGVFEAQRLYAAQPDFAGCFFVNVATELRDPENDAVQMACLMKSELGEYVIRQATSAGVAEPAVLAEQLSILHTGAADYALLTGEYPESVIAAVQVLLDAHGMP